jgi:hypothetical protein
MAGHTPSTFGVRLVDRERVRPAGFAIHVIHNRETQVCECGGVRATGVHQLGEAPRATAAFVGVRRPVGLPRAERRGERLDARGRASSRVGAPPRSGPSVPSMNSIEAANQIAAMIPVVVTSVRGSVEHHRECTARPIGELYLPFILPRVSHTGI